MKLVFNWRELPLAARVLEVPGCLTAYQHARFAPLLVPASLREDPRGRPPPGEAEVPNLTPLGLRWAGQLGSPRAVFEHLATHLMSEPFQGAWAPAYGRTRTPLIAPPGWR